MTETALLRWILLLPAAGVLVCLSATLARRPRIATLAGPGVVLGAFALSVLACVKLSALPESGVLRRSRLHLDPGRAADGRRRRSASIA